MVAEFAGRVGARRHKRLAPALLAPLGPSLAVGYLSLLVLVPLAAVLSSSFDGGFGAFWNAITEPSTVAALKVTMIATGSVVGINLFAGTAIAWVLVRDHFFGKAAVEAIVDLPLALPTVVAGVVLLALYGPDSPVHWNVTDTRVALVLALCFVTLPFSVRSVQPVIADMDREMEEAASSLGAGPLSIFVKVILPNLAPAVLTGAGLGFARALGEYGSVNLISGNLPFRTEVASVQIAGLVESGDNQAAAAVSLLLLVLSLVVLAVLDVARRFVLPEKGQR